MRRLRFLLALLLVVAVPFQGALAASVAQCTAPHHHDAGGDDSHHGKNSAGPCAACCSPAALASRTALIAFFVAYSPLNAASDLPLLGELPRGLDRPPRSAH